MIFRPGAWGREQGRRPVVVALAGAAAMAVTGPASATWSIIVVDTRTNEVAIGCATCLTQFDLERWTPVLVVGKGGASAQSFVDSSGRNREMIWNGLHAGEEPLGILEKLEASDPGHQTRQYGIVDTTGLAATFTGAQAGQWAGGLTGQVGTLVYAIQGNVLTGEPVVTAAERALINTPGDLADKLMASMEAAAAMGGDGRCSCSNGAPDDCGSPPPDFEKSAHCAYVILARPGDLDGTCDTNFGCASGDYYMNFNIAGQWYDDPDPVLQLREQFDAWRLDMLGRPDAVRSIVTMSDELIEPDGAGTVTMDIDLRDWTGAPIDVDVRNVIVKHEPGVSAGISRIGPVADLGGGRFRVQLTAGVSEGVDTFRIKVSEGGDSIRLTPQPTLAYVVPDGRLNLDPPTPGRAGVANDFCVRGAEPGENVYFVFGPRIGIHDSPCGPIGIYAPRIAGRVAVDDTGAACFSTPIPRRLHDRSLAIQAVGAASCDRSDVVVWTF